MHACDMLSVCVIVCKGSVLSLRPWPLYGMVIANTTLLCECQRALYGIQCVLRIFWQTWLDIVTNKKNFDALFFFPCNTLTHSTNEDLLKIKRKGDPEVSYPLSYVRYHRNPEPVCNKSHFVSLFYLYWYFLIY